MRVTIELWGGPHDGRRLQRTVVSLAEGGKGLPAWVEYRDVRAPESEPIRYLVREVDRTERYGQALSKRQGSCRVRYDLARR